MLWDYNVLDSQAQTGEIIDLSIDNTQIYLSIIGLGMLLLQAYLTGAMGCAVGGEEEMNSRMQSSWAERKGGPRRHEQERVNKRQRGGEGKAALPKVEGRGKGRVNGICYTRDS